MAKPQRVHYTWDDYVKLPDDGKRYEIIDGELFVTAAPFTDHQYTVWALIILIDGWHRLGGGMPFSAPVDVVLANDTIVQPDLIWISEERIVELIGDQVRGIPDLVIEVLSPSTARRDRNKKSEIYERFGAREYWLVDPRQKTVEIRSLSGGKFVPHAQGCGDVVLSSSLDARLTVQPSRLFRNFKTRGQ